MAYKGYPFLKHLRLPIAREHFSCWIALFTQIISVLFKGAKAAVAKQKATSITYISQMKLDLIGKS